MGGARGRRRCALGALVVLFVLAGASRHGSDALTLRLERVLPSRLAGAAGRLRARSSPRGLARRAAAGRACWWRSCGRSRSGCRLRSGIWAVAVAFQPRVPFTGSFLIIALLVVGVAVPTPGAVGGFHEAFRLGATSFFGAPDDAAVGAAIVLHAVIFVPVAAPRAVLRGAGRAEPVSGMRALADQAEAAGRRTT